MANLWIRTPPTTEESLARMRRDACYDVADDDRVSDECVPKAVPHGVSSREVKVATSSVPKMFLSNDCAFNCAYCGCRCSRDEASRYCMSPRELAELSVTEARQNKRGVFLTSAIYKNPDTTQELIIETLRIMRAELGYGGYIHAKVMPGADPLLIKQTGFLADRLSVNIEVARSEGYAMVAKQKNKGNILAPMRQISELIADARSVRGIRYATTQTTQLMAGATAEDDRVILTLAQALYKTYRLRRVYYTAFQYQQPAKGYDLAPVATPRWRMNRLYQADRLLALYRFSPEELAPPGQAFLEEDIDPKTAWALRNMHLFPVEVNTADYETLLRVPGFGAAAADKILEARRYARVTHDTLKHLRIPVKRSVYFITCGGRFLGGKAAEGPALRGLLAGMDPMRAHPLEGQMSIADFGIGF